MPLPSQPKVAPKVEPNLVKHEEVYQGPVVETRKLSYNTLSTYFAGSRLPCDYYLQVQGRDSEAKSFQEDLPSAWGQYILIRGFELVVTQALTHQQSDDDNRGFISTGAALVYSIVTPQMGDVFIADIGNGENALFQVTQTTRKTIYAESATEITYKATKFLSAITLAELNKRTVERQVFDRENMRNGVQPLIREEQIDVIKQLGRAYDRLTHLYLRDHYSTKFKTLQVPRPNNVPTYDPYMTRFVRATFDGRAFPQVLQITELGVAHDVFSNQYSLLDAILKMDAALLYSVSKHGGVSDISAVRARPMMNSIYFSGFHQVVSFFDVPYSVDSAGKSPHAFMEFDKADVRQKDMASILPVLNLTEPSNIIGNDIPLIHRVVVDTCYILSEAFYSNTPGQSVLENLLRERLESETTNLPDLLRVAEAAPKFDNLERFYYIPLILALIKLAPGVL